MKEKLVITCEIENLPDNAKFLDFNLTIMEDGFLTHIFRNWKKITIVPAVVTKLEVEKQPHPDKKENV